MVKGYKKFNESKSKSHKKKINNQKKDRFQQQNSWKENVPKFNVRTEPVGMKIEISDRLKYIIIKISEKGNAIAKDFVSLLDKPDVKFNLSYIDITTRGGDSLTYLNDNTNIPENELYRSNKRQISKVYKVIKSIFGSKYTKMEVSKFVSMFKQIYDQGPDKSLTRPKRTESEMLRKIIDDTKNDKLKWKKISEIGEITRYEIRVKVTDKKYIALVLFYFPDIKEDLIFMTINLHNELGITKEQKSTWITTLKYQDLKEFLEIFRKKYIK